MKISHDHGMVDTVLEQRRNGQKKAGSADFGAVLRETVQASQTPSGGSCRLHPGAATAPPAPVAGLQPGDNRKATVIREVEKLLDMLDDYRRKLGDSRISLRQMEPLVVDIGRAKDQLVPLLEQLAGDDGLKEIVNRTLVTASSEVVRYYRGDLLAQ